MHVDTDLPWQFNLLCKTFDTLRVWSEKKYRIFFHNVPTLVGIFIILKDLFEFKKRSQKGRNNKYHLFNGGNIRENFICENITPFFGNRIDFEMYVFNWNKNYSFGRGKKFIVIIIR